MKSSSWEKHERGKKTPKQCPFFMVNFCRFVKF
jgi:hypothetical protein